MPTINSQPIANHPSSKEASMERIHVPYYAVIFSSTLTGNDIGGYYETANEIEELAKQQDGFVGIESGSRTKDTKFGITISYWKDLTSISKWKSNAKHIVAQRLGKKVWYQNYQLRIAKVEREYGFEKEEEEEEMDGDDGNCVGGKKEDVTSATTTDVLQNE